MAGALERVKHFARGARRPKLNGESILLLLTIAAVVLGIIVGASVKASDPKLTPRELAYIKFPGEIFLRMLKLLILPLITSSLISSLTSLDTRTAGRMGLLATSFYMMTTLLAVILGIILVVLIKPGSYGQELHGSVNAKHEECRGTQPGDTIMDLIRNMFPQNIMEAAFKSQATCIYEWKRMGNETEEEIRAKAKLSSDDYWALRDANTSRLWQSYAAMPESREKMGMNILGLVVFSIIFGAVINSMGEQGLPLARFFSALEGAMMRMVSLVIWISPLGIFFLIVAQILAMEDLMGELRRLSMYMLTVLVGLAIHGCVTLPLLFTFLARRNPFKFVYGMLQALLTALGTASSSATMPLTLRCLEENNGISPRVSRFMIPLGATINMDGTALYEAVAALYIGQTLGQHMSAGDIILISLTATLASIGAAGIPQAGLVTMIMVLTAVDLPPEMFALIVPVDWFLDRIRTMINVHGDSMGTGIVQRFCQAQLDALDKADEAEKAETNGIQHANLEIDLAARNTSQKLPPIQPSAPRQS